MIDKFFSNDISAPLIGELHSRPFLSMEPQSRVAYLTLQHRPDASLDDNLKVLRDLTNALGVEVPEATKSFFWHDFGDYVLKWERHSEFSSYLLLIKNAKDDYFSPHAFDLFTSAWLSENKAQILTSAIIEIPKPVDELIKGIEPFRDYFSRSSFSAARVLESAAVIASDFQIDQNGHMRMLLLPSQGTGANRLGRVAQRLVEIETYVVASMLALPVARSIARELPEMEADFSPVIAGISSETSDAAVSLNAILQMAGRVEQIISEASFRFGASEAYAELVESRVEVLREERLANFQLFSEFMLRRYEPGMRTVYSTRTRLQEFSTRLERAANFLRTKVEVSNSESQRELLHSMNKRAEAQYRLQETVEGLSVVAISYYAVSLVGYFLVPLAKSWHIEKTWLMAAAVPPVVLLVWLFIHRIKAHVVHKDTDTQ